MKILRSINWPTFGLSSLATVGLIFLLIFAPVALVPAPIETGSQGTTNFSDLGLSGSLVAVGNITGATLTATTGFAGNITGNVAGNVTGNVTGDLTGDVAGNVTGNVVGNVEGNVVGALTLGADDFATLTPGTSITVTNGAAFTPTATYQPLVAAAEVTPTITAGATAGRVLLLTNTGTNVINLADTGTLKLTAAAALGQYDTLLLISDGTNWLELSRADN